MAAEDDSSENHVLPHRHADDHGPVRLAEVFSRARAVLQALVANTGDDETLIIATDGSGFPVAQRVIKRPENLPHALVIGRHNRCALTIPGDSRVSLRHILLTAWPGQGMLRLRGYDLGGRAGIVLADGKRVPGFSALGHVALSFGRTAMFVIPGGRKGHGLLTGSSDESFERLTGINLKGGGARLAMSAMAEPSVAQLGGYRPLDVEARPQSRGVLRLRSLKAKSDRADQKRELDVDSEQLQRGLLIGRYSDRCSLAGSGRNLSRVHALVTEEGPHSLLVYDLASTNGVRPGHDTEGPSHPVVRLKHNDPVMLGHFELSWQPASNINVH
ncbi:MAG: FHA domain-containing protein [Myxococcales bacterium]|nr:FHA domain-containing protein [Myxococcales bacterium]